MSVKSFRARGIRVRQARVRGDVGARLQLPAVAHEVLDDVAAVAEGIHDVAEVAGVFEAEGVSELVEARQVDDGVAEEIVGAAAFGDVGPERGESGRTKTRATRLPYRQVFGFAVLSLSRTGPVEADDGVLFRGGAQRR